MLPYASITKRQAGKELVDFKELALEGVFAFTDDGVGVQQACDVRGYETSSSS